MWTVALVCSGNALGLTYEQYTALDAVTLAAERTRIHTLFEGSRPALSDRHPPRAACGHCGYQYPPGPG